MSELIKREDAISRKELLDYINDHREDFSDYSGYSQMFDFVDTMPTVDAVPVEWIESYVRDARATGDFSDEMCAVAIEAMLNDYRADGEKRKL